MTNEEIKTILEKHKLWLTHKEGGECADFSGEDLRGFDFSGQNLRLADFSGANCEGVTFNRGDYFYANFNRANCAGANFKGANCAGTRFFRANCTGADFSGANCRYANFTEANLDNIAYDDSALLKLQCPEEGSFIGYKKCWGDLIVKLEIPADAKRSSATSRKCRCSAAKVLSITNIDGSDAGDVAYSLYDELFKYRVGEIVSVNNFDENRWNECSAGIHFFMTRDEAVGYSC